ncbi:MAG: aspartate--tRNA(Asn) ligase [Patescibacteria group bacterium]
MSKEQKRIMISALKEKVGEQVVIKGFVHVIRNQGKIKFVIIRDISGQVQCVVLKDSTAFNVVDSLSHEYVVEVHGLVKEEKQAPGGFEIETKEIIVLSEADPQLPIPVIVEKGGEEPETAKRFDYRWLDLRREEKRKIFEVWTSLEKGFRDFINDSGYIQVYTPSLMMSPSESGSEVFEVKYFDRLAYLAQSPQFYKQLGMAAGFEKVFMIGPVFRAEPSFTTRHMTEFTGWDFELSYIESHHDVMDEEEKMLIAGFTRLKNEALVDVEIPSRPFPRITMKEAKEKLKKAGILGDKEHDLSPEEEREISNIVKEETGHDFVFLIDWDISIRPFYHMRHEDNKSLTKSFDLLYKGLEITTGAQREHRADVLIAQAKEKGMELSEIDYYIEFFRYGCPPHGGGGIGPGRIIMQLLDLPSVKEATYLPRDVKRLAP